jgi:hypothetical protein
MFQWLANVVSDPAIVAPTHLMPTHLTQEYEVFYCVHVVFRCIYAIFFKVKIHKNNVQTSATNQPTTCSCVPVLESPAGA